MMGRIFRVEYFITLFLELLIIVGIIVCGVYNETPYIVELASLLAFGGWIGVKAFSHFQNAARQKLELAEASERAYFNVILARIEQGQDVDSSLVERLKEARSESSDLYKSLYGHYRPAAATSIAKVTSAAAD